MTQRTTTKQTTSDTSIIAILLAWGDVMGRQDTTWAELSRIGTSLTLAEAHDHVTGALTDPMRNEIYASLLEAHPELVGW